MNFPEGSFTQIAYVVRSLEAAAATWQALAGAGPFYVLCPETRNTIYRGEASDDRYRLALGFLGATLIELIEPLDDKPSILNELLALRGEGFHHICPKITALKGQAFEARCHELESAGFKVVMTNEVVGLGRAAFYDALDSIGGFIEVFELGDGYQMLSRMFATHARWDGCDPVRPMEQLFS